MLTGRAAERGGGASAQGPDKISFLCSQGFKTIFCFSTIKLKITIGARNFCRKPCPLVTISWNDDDDDDGDDDDDDDDDDDVDDDDDDDDGDDDDDDDDGDDDDDDDIGDDDDDDDDDDSGGLESESGDLS